MLEIAPRRYDLNLRYTYVTITMILLVAIPIGYALPPTACACGSNPYQQFLQLTSTTSGFPTWDSDQIEVFDFTGETTGYTGDGVYVSVLDTGLVANWRDYLPAARVRDDLGKGFVENLHVNENGEIVTDGIVHETTFIGSTGSGHGTHVTSTIIGYFYKSPSDTSPNIPPIVVRGIAPKATIIPVKVLETYNFPGFTGPGGVTFGTDRMVATGIRYATALKLSGFAPMIVTMSLGGPEPSTEIEDAINDAIAAGVIVVAAAGNDGVTGMDWPGAYPQVISAGASGWTYEWYRPSFGVPPPRYRLWWLQSNLAGYNDIPDTTPVSTVYVTDFSSRENDTRVTGFDQELDVLAPGSWVRGPFPATPGYAHLPWWSQGVAGFTSPVLPGGNNFFYVGGTSMSTPHVTSVAALMLEKTPSLTQGTIESILKSTALPIAAGSAMVFDIFTNAFQTISWELDGYEATGAGLVQADAAVAMA